MTELDSKKNQILNDKTEKKYKTVTKKILRLIRQTCCPSDEIIIVWTKEN